MTAEPYSPQQRDRNSTEVNSCPTKGRLPAWQGWFGRAPQQSRCELPCHLLWSKLEVLPGHVEDPPPPAGQCIAPCSVALPLETARVVAIAVGLDRDLHLGIGKIDPGQEPSAFTNVVLRYP